MALNALSTRKKNRPRMVVMVTIGQTMWLTRPPLGAAH